MLKVMLLLSCLVATGLCTLYHGNSFGSGLGSLFYDGYGNGLGLLGNSGRGSGYGGNYYGRGGYGLGGYGSGYGNRWGRRSSRFGGY